MRPISAGALESLPGSHELAMRVRLVAPGQTGAAPQGIDFAGQADDDQPGTLQVLDGQSVFDATAEVWGESNGQVAVDGWDSRAGRHPLQPYGNEIFVERGIAYGGVAEYVPLGYFKLDTVGEQTAGSGVLDITALDRMRPVIEGKLTAPVQFTAATSVSTVFAALVGEIHPNGLIEFADDDVASANIGRMVVVDSDRHGFLRSLATAHGQIMYYDHRGVLVVKPPPSITVPVWDVEAGEGGVLVSASRKIGREGVYNAVLVIGEGGDEKQPVRLLVVDSNPESPTHWGGPYGKVPYEYSTSLVTEWTQGNAAGRALLERLLGLPYYIDFSALPNPALEPFDPVRVRYATSAAREIHVIQQLSIPWTAQEPLTGSTRESSKVLISVETGSE